jgi:hypothetical protein
MVHVSFGQRVGRVAKKTLRIIILVVVVIGLITFSFLNWAVYERGVKAGKVLQVTEKGVIFKTYEGKLNLETFGALKGTSPIAESWDFSVEDENVVKELEQVALSGERVNLKYIKRYSRFFWRGDTNVFVEGIERQK